MDFLNLVSQNLLTPAILFFFLGVVAGSLKSDLEVPGSISRYLSLYLMMAIGFKGGVAIASTPHFSFQIIYVIVLSLIVSFLLPFIGYFFLIKTTKLDRATAAAVAAHYGSISMVTFVTATTFLKTFNISYEGYIIAILALMEAPAILSGLYIAHKAAPSTNKHQKEQKKLSKEIFTNGSILLLFGTFLIGWITGQPGLDKVSGFLVNPFTGFLCFFLMDMGLMVAKNLSHLKKFTFSLIAFGFYMPLVGASLGLFIAKIVNMDLGTATLFITLCASASYIAVPAAMRLALPEAKAAIYLPMALGITFPFNVIFGIPIYFTIAKLFIW